MDDISERPTWFSTIKKLNRAEDDAVAGQSRLSATHEAGPNEMGHSRESTAARTSLRGPYRLGAASAKSSPVLNIFRKASTAEIPVKTPLDHYNLASPALNVFARGEVSAMDGGVIGENQKEKVQGLPRGIRYLEAKKKEHEAAQNWQEVRVAEQAIDKKKIKLQRLQASNVDALERERKPRFWLLGRKGSSKGGAEAPESTEQKQSAIEENEAKVFANLFDMGLVGPMKPKDLRSSTHVSTQQDRIVFQADEENREADRQSPYSGVKTNDGGDYVQSRNMSLANQTGPETAAAQSHKPTNDLSSRNSQSRLETSSAANEQIETPSNVTHRNSQSLSLHPGHQNNQLNHLQDQVRALQSERD